METPVINNFHCAHCVHNPARIILKFNAKWYLHFHIWITVCHHFILPALIAQRLHSSKMLLYMLWHSESGGCTVRKQRGRCVCPSVCRHHSLEVNLCGGLRLWTGVLVLGPGPAPTWASFVVRWWQTESVGACVCIHVAGLTSIHKTYKLVWADSAHALHCVYRCVHL